MLGEIWAAAGGRPEALDRMVVSGAETLSSVFCVSDLAAAAIGAAGLAVSELIGASRGAPPAVTIDRRLASFWFASSVRAQGWSPPPPWDPIAGDYRAADAWIRLHTNAPAHRRAALAIIGVGADPLDVARAVRNWSADALEDAILAAGGCAARMRSAADWADHPQGRSLAAEPLIHIEAAGSAPMLRPAPDPSRPLRGIKVLDLTRVLAGPVATRFLAGFGASVLRIDPPDWDEPALVADVMVGKATARLDLRHVDDRERLTQLLSEADILVHGYRPGALDRLGLTATVRRRIRPGLIDVSLDAYGWSGPWRTRRGFDSLVQMSTGIADAGMRLMNKPCPTPLPVQALDHATGYLMAAAAVLGLARQRDIGQGVEIRTSLARTAALLIAHPARPDTQPFRPEDPNDVADGVEATPWGPARRLAAPLNVDGAPMYWDRIPRPIGSDPADWPDHGA